MKKTFENYTPTFIAGMVVLIFVFVVGIISSMKPIKEGEETSPSTNSIEKIGKFYPVLHVFDGDTFSVEIDGRTEMVRAIGIDAPETGEKYTDQECFAKQSKEGAIELLLGENVKLDLDPTQADRDKYDRLLRYVRLKDGTFFNLVMIERGYAKEYTYQNSTYQHHQEFIDAQMLARNKSLGMWAECEL